MKRIVLSRKGFDSSAGGRPSPILLDGRLLPLPIPQDSPSPARFADLSINGLTGTEALAKAGVPHMAEQYCHHDPDLQQGLFGQHGPSLTELDNLGVGEGDLFLFFGWFQQPLGGQDMHHIFGWLQVAGMVRGGEAIAEHLRARGAEHPHGHGDFVAKDHNALYIGGKSLDAGRGDEGLPGYGMFAEEEEELVLSTPGQDNRSVWRLPEEHFRAAADAGGPFMSKRLKWIRRKPLLADSGGRGQEFVLDCQAYPQVADWALGLIRRYAPFS